jgi:hypothetical protein
MFAINHAATSLVLKKHFDDVSMPWLLGSVQAVEIGWVVLNLLGIERTTTEETVRYVGDIHLAHMPYSHSVGTTVGLALLAFVIFAALGKRRLGAAVGLGIASHLALDLLTHAPDIAILPFVEGPMLGLGLYGAAPLAGFAFELLFGVFCWWYFGGNRRLLAAIVGFNAANFTMFSTAIVGIEGALAGHPSIIATVIGVQIVVTLFVVGWFAREEESDERGSLGSGAVGSAEPAMGQTV